jgi:hypothetical protein
MVLKVRWRSGTKRPGDVTSRAGMRYFGGDLSARYDAFPARVPLFLPLPGGDRLI